MEILAIIPARGGSKGVPGKNIAPVAGKPLLAHTVEQALAARLVNRVLVSTDDEAIAAVARAYGAEVVARPAGISGDTATSESALLHVLDTLTSREAYAPDLVVFLQCTSPVRRPGDIDAAIQTLLDQQADSLLSVVPSHHWLWRVVDGRPDSYNFDYRRRPRRQERPAEYDENGSIYVFKPHILRQFNNRLGGRIALYEMDGWSMIDIDTPQDLALCEIVLGVSTLAS